MTIRAEAGETTFSVLRRALQETRGVLSVDVFHNEIHIKVHPDSHIDDLCMIYDLKHQIRRLKAGHRG